MIRRLDEGDREAVRRLLLGTPQLNLYLLGNLDAYGFAPELSEFLGDVVDGVVDRVVDGRLRGVVNCYMRAGWTIYGEAGADWAGLAHVVDEVALPNPRLQDNPGGVPSLLPYLRRYAVPRVSEEELMELDAGALSPRPELPGVVVRRATGADLGRLVDFYAEAEEMTRAPEAVERPLRDRRVWLAEIDGAVVATALTNAESVGYAMIGGVFTPPAYRGRGYAGAVVGALCGELQAEGICPLLYWHNPAAGAVYRRLGFRRIGTWRSVRLARRYG